MNIPLETVVKLLMENAGPAKAGGGQVMLGGEVYDSLREDDLRGYIRDYLSTLVPKPVKLSECEEGIEYLMVEKPRRVFREFIYAVEIETQQRIARAEQVEVIQPVERGDE